VCPDLGSQPLDWKRIAFWVETQDFRGAVTTHYVDLHVVDLAAVGIESGHPLSSGRQLFKERVNTDDTGEWDMMGK